MHSHERHPTQPRIVFDPAAFTSPANAARALNALGIQPVVVQVGEKRPIMEDWLNHPPEAAIAILESIPTGNVGMKLGALSGGLLDIDLDAHVARRIIPPLLERFIDGKCPAYGRKGGDVGHLLVQATDKDPGRTSQWSLNEAEAAALGITADGAGKKKRRMIAELRGTGGQSVVPPSKFDGGSVVEWRIGGEVPRAPRAELERIVALGCALSVVAFGLRSPMGPERSLSPSPGAPGVRVVG